MTAKGHVFLALPIGIAISEFINLTEIELVIFLGSIIVGSLFPDIDEPYSYIGRKAWFLSWFVKLLSLIFPTFKHRGITHIPLIPIVLIASGYWGDTLFLFGFGIGWMAHTFGDLITVGGVNGYLYPLFPNTRIRLLPFLPIYTGGVIEHVIIFGLMALTLLLTLLLVGVDI